MTEIQALSNLAIRESGLFQSANGVQMSSRLSVREP